VSLRQVSLHKQRKVARALSARNAPDFSLCACGALLGGAWKQRPRNKNRINSFRAEARVTFVLAKVTKTAVARRDPDRLRRSGPLRFSDGGARGPNSLRSDKGRSSAPPSCDARLALWLEDQDQDQDQGQEQGQDQRQQQRQLQQRKQEQRLRSPPAAALR